MHLPSLLAQVYTSETTQITTQQLNPAVVQTILIVYLAVLLLVVIGLWKVFTKADQPGWAAIVPILNIYILCKVTRKPGWWVLLMFIPFVNIIIMILLSLALAENFGKGGGFAIGLVLLPFIFIPILGFGDAVYRTDLPPALA